MHPLLHVLPAPLVAETVFLLWHTGALTGVLNKGRYQNMIIGEIIDNQTF